MNVVKRDAFVAGFMAWAGVCYSVTTELRIIYKGSKVHCKFYIITKVSKHLW